MGVQMLLVRFLRQLGIDAGGEDLFAGAFEEAVH